MRVRKILLPSVFATLLAGCGAAEPDAGTDPAVDPVVAQALAHVAARPDLSFSSPEQAFSVRDVIIDEDGTEHVRLDRSVRGLRVIGGDIVVHSGVAGELRGISGTLSTGLSLDLQPAIPAEDAIAIADGEQAAALTEMPQAEQVIYARGAAPVLAWEVLLVGEHSDGTPSGLHVIVSADDGAVLDRWDDVKEAAAAGTGRSLFSGTVSLTTNSVAGGYELKDPSRGNTYTIDMRSRSNNGSIFTDADNAWGNGTTSDNASVAVDAQYGTAVTWDYYLYTHGRNGIANNGTGAYNRVHYNRRYNNAFWSDACFCMTYGDGDGVTYNPFASLDVAGHEMTHGVTSRTANLTYSGESGGLNEAMSDIFGTATEFYAANASDVGDYLIGEKLYRSGNGALRYMYNPDLDGRSKGCYISTLGSLDVHYSSGVANHFYYLLSEGSASALTNTCGTGAVLSGIGRAAAERIIYRALTVYMTSNTNYAGARTATLSAATDLYGAGSAEYAAVAAAWSAVLVN